RRSDPCAGSPLQVNRSHRKLNATRDPSSLISSERQWLPFSSIPSSLQTAAVVITFFTSDPSLGSMKIPPFSGTSTNSLEPSAVNRREITFNPPGISSLELPSALATNRASRPSNHATLLPSPL